MILKQGDRRHQQVKSAKIAGDARNPLGRAANGRNIGDAKQPGSEQGEGQPIPPAECPVTPPTDSQNQDCRDGVGRDSLDQQKTPNRCRRAIRSHQHNRKGVAHGQGIEAEHGGRDSRVDASQDESAPPDGWFARDPGEDSNDELK